MRSKAGRTETPADWVATRLPLDSLTADNRNRLAAWFDVYMKVDGRAASEKTISAKLYDIGRFLDFFQAVTRTDHPDAWTRSVSEDFIKHLEKVKAKQTGRPLSPTTINRILATLRTASRWINKHRPFLAGPPMDRIRDMDIDDPDWNGLKPIEVTRLKIAAEQLIRIQRRANQTPYRNRAILLTLLHTGLRQSELRNLDLSQNQEKHFHRIRRKGRKETRKLLVAKPAREALDDYFQFERGRSPGPLIQSKTGRTLSPQDLNAALRRIASHANSSLPEPEHISISAHMLRHTALKAAADTKDIRLALDMSGHSSERYIWRYTKLSDEERDEAVESLFD